jgi:hypothetical protein
LAYPLLPHMTYIMQPLDVGVFQPYKHWHDEAIKESVARLEVEYGIRAFFRDPAGVREKAFKRRTIRHAFRDSGMWPVSASKCIDQPPDFLEQRQEEEES